MAKINLPNNDFPLRQYQRDLRNYIIDGGKNAICMLHRKAGKDEMFLHTLAAMMMIDVGDYLYLFPTSTMARTSIWKTTNPLTGRNRIDEAFPEKLIKNRNNVDLRIVLINGSSLTFSGFVECDKHAPLSLRGIAISEAALDADALKRALGVLRPCLKIANGFLMINSTPRGKNYYHDLYYSAKKDDSWFVQTLRADQSGVFTAKELEEEKKQYIILDGEKRGEAKFNREYMVEFNDDETGSVYAELLEIAEREGRIVDDMRSHPIYSKYINDDEYKPICSFDIGVSNKTAIWIAKLVNGQLLIYESYENSREGMRHYVDWIIAKEPSMRYAILPHDAAVFEPGSGKTRAEQVYEYGLMPKIGRMMPKKDSLQAAVETFPSIIFCRKGCASGLRALRAYHFDYKEKTDTLSRDVARHWSNDASDSLKYLCCYIGSGEKYIKYDGIGAILQMTRDKRLLRDRD